MATPGYQCSLGVTGASTTFTTQGFTNLGTDRWQITSAARRIWNPAVTVDFFDNGVPIDPSDIDTIDYLFGIVTFEASTAFAGPITATGEYFPTHTITEGHYFTIVAERDMLDDTVFGDTAHSRQGTIIDATGEIQIYEIFETDYDGGAGEVILHDLWENETPCVFTFNLNSGATCQYRVLAIITELNIDAGVGDLIEGTISFQAQPTQDADGRPVHFSYIDA
jgi:hypothetical protein